MSIASTLTKISRAIVKQAVGIHTANLLGNIREAYKKQDAAENHERDAASGRPQLPRRLVLRDTLHEQDLRQIESGRGILIPMKIASKEEVEGKDLFGDL